VKAGPNFLVESQESYRRAKHEHERTLAFAEIALQQIRALRLPASPRNFEIWYQYATGYSPGLNRTINDTLAQKGTLEESDVERIYEMYLSPGRDSRISRSSAPRA
jgi:diguanylate cyclase